MTTMRRLTCYSASLALLLLGSAARAQVVPPKPRVIYALPKVHLLASFTYERKPGAEVCPNKELAALIIAGDVHYDLFQPDPGRIMVGSVRVAVARVASGFEAEWQWNDPQGVVRQRRKFLVDGSRLRDCEIALMDVATSISVTFLSMELEYGKRFAEKPTAPACSLETPRALCEDSRFSVWPREQGPSVLGYPGAQKLPERWPITVRVDASTWGEVIASGWGSLGFSAGIGARWRGVSSSVEAHYDPPLGPQVYEGGRRVNFARLSGALLLCAHWGWFVGCGVGDTGGFWFPNSTRKLPGAAPYGAVGIRTGLEFPLAPPRLFLRVAVDLRAPVHPVNYTAAGTTLFRPAGPGVGVGLGVVVEFPP